MLGFLTWIFESYAGFYFLYNLPDWIMQQYKIMPLDCFASLAITKLTVGAVCLIHALREHFQDT